MANVAQKVNPKGYDDDFMNDGEARYCNARSARHKAKKRTSRRCRRISAQQLKGGDDG